MDKQVVIAHYFCMLAANLLSKLPRIDLSSALRAPPLPKLSRGRYAHDCPPGQVRGVAVFADSGGPQKKSLIQATVEDAAFSACWSTLPSPFLVMTKRTCSCAWVAGSTVLVPESTGLAKSAMLFLADALNMRGPHTATLRGHVGSVCEMFNSAR